MSLPLLVFGQSNYYLLIQIYILNDKQCKSGSVLFAKTGHSRDLAGPVLKYLYCLDFKPSDYCHSEKYVMVLKYCIVWTLYPVVIVILFS